MPPYPTQSHRCTCHCRHQKQQELRKCSHLTTELPRMAAKNSVQSTSSSQKQDLLAPHDNIPASVPVQVNCFHDLRTTIRFTRQLMSRMAYRPCRLLASMVGPADALPNKKSFRTFRSRSCAKMLGHGLRCWRNIGCVVASEKVNSRDLTKEKYPTR